MAQWSVPLADVRVAEDDIAAVADTYRSGWLSQGPRTEELEEAFAAYTGARYALGVANGTAALHLVALAAGLGPGDEVVVPSMTFVATVNAVAYTGATPVFADIASVTEPWLSAAAVEAVLTDRTKAVMTMSYGGHAGETAALRDLCERRGLILLEDAAHAAGSRLEGRHLGTYGAAGAFSMFSNKNLAVGEGGLATTDDEDMAARMRLLRSHGMTTLSWDRHRGHATGYDVVALGFNYRIDEARATLATRRLARLDDENDARRRLDGRYRELLADVDVECVAAPTDGLRSAHHLFAVLVPEDADRAAIRQALAERRIQTSMHYPPVHGFSIYAGSEAELPVTDAYAARTVTLPLFAHMTDEQQDLVVGGLADALSPRGAAAGRSA
jgi:dTDP-4-amino-4,6-dideoxygalactose transaminase